MMDGGEAAFRLIDEMQTAAEAARAALPDLATPVWTAAEALREATETLVAQEMNDRFAGAVAYQSAFARVLGCHYHLRAAAADPARCDLALFAIRRLLPQHIALLAQAREGAAGIYALTPEALAR
jgi:acyl-CoA dehydrogenase